MDNRGTPAPSNSQIRQNRDALFPNKRVTQNVEDHEPSSRRVNKEAEKVADENNRATPIVISSGSEDDSDDDAAYEEAERRRKGKMVVSASNPEPKLKGKPVAHAIPAGLVIKEKHIENFVTEESESETYSEDNDDDYDAEYEYQRQLNAAKQESLNIQNVEAPERDEYERQLQVAIQESLKSYYNNSVGISLDAHALRTETGLARGNIGNDSTPNDCANEVSVDEGAQTEALDVVIGNESPKGKRKIKAKKPKLAEPDVARGKFINSSCDAEPTGSMPYQRVSSRGRLLKPMSKLLQLANMTDGEGTSGSKRKQHKQRLLSNVIARVVDGSEAAPLPLNHGPRHTFRRYGSQHNRLQSGVAGTSEPSAPVVTRAGQANGVADRSGVGREVGGSETDADYSIPDLIAVPFLDPTSVAGQASEANAVSRQTDMAVPLLEPMVCVTNRNPMDLTSEELEDYMRTE